MQGAAAAADQHQMEAKSYPACIPGQQLVAGVSQTWTGYRTLGINFSLTNRSTACEVDSLVSVQFHGPHGEAIGPVATSAAAAHHHLIRETFQLVDDVRLGTCSKSLDATRIRIGVDGSSTSVGLKAPLPVCVQAPYFNGLVVPPAFPVPPRCTTGQLNVHLGFTQGEAGNLVTPITVVNVSGAACTVSGFPTVQGADGPGADLVGPPAAKITPIGSGTPVKDLNHTGASASSIYVQAETSNYDPGRCGQLAAPGINVAFMGLAPEYLSYKVSVCSKLNSTSVTRIGVFL